MIPERRAYAEKRLKKLKDKISLLRSVPKNLITDEGKRALVSSQQALKRWQKELAS